MKDYSKLLVRNAQPKPSTIFLYGPPGLGKTSVGCAFPAPLFLIDKQEDGINTLKNAGLVSQDIPVMPVAETWTELLEQLKWIAS